MLCQLSYEGNKGTSNPYLDFDHGLDSRSNVRRPGIGAITSSCGPKNLGMTPSLGIFFARFRETFAPVAQWIAHQTSILGVAGSSPAWGIVF